MGKPLREQARENPVQYWSPFLHTSAPKLRTTFGNFSTLNLVERFTFNTGTVTDRVLVVPWVPSPVACLHWISASSTITAQLFNPLLSSTPLALRPLRMGIEVKNLTTAVNVGGLVQVLSVDNALDIGALLNASGSAITTADTTSWTSLITLVAGSLETKTYSAQELVDGHVFTSVPSSWPAYNQYRDFIEFNGTDGATIRSDDWLNLANGLASSTYVPPSTTNPVLLENTVGDVPPLRCFVLVFKAGSVANNYEITIRRQDGARYPSNTLGHMFHHTPPKGSTADEDRLISSSHSVSKDPSSGVSRSILDSMSQVANKVISDQIGGLTADLNNLRMYGGPLASNLFRLMAPKPFKIA